MTKRKGLIVGEDRLYRCFWAGRDPLYLDYHDNEWGYPVAADRALFEKICLEGFQAGLSWLTILRKRENFRRAFCNFDLAKVARFNSRSVDRLLGDASIVRHRQKIESTINNARCAIKLVAEFGSLGAYFWRFEPAAGTRPKRLTHAALMKMIHTPQSRALSKDLKSRGFCFVGPTTCYAFMQAMGLVNDHLEGCAAKEKVQRARKTFVRPSS